MAFSVLRACSAGMLAFAVSAVASTAEAAVRFAYTGECDLHCAEVGLVAGESVSGYIDFADSAVVANGSISDDDILGFDFTLGNIGLGTPEDSLIVLNGPVAFDSAASGFTGTGQLQFRLGAAGIFVGALFADDSSWFVAPPPDFLTSASGTGGFDRVTSVVPIPAGLPLLLSGLAGMCWVSGSRRRGPGANSAC